MNLTADGVASTHVVQPSACAAATSRPMSLAGGAAQVIAYKTRVATTARYLPARPLAAQALRRPAGAAVGLRRPAPTWCSCGPAPASWRSCRRWSGVVVDGQLVGERDRLAGEHESGGELSGLEREVAAHPRLARPQQRPA